jgi:acetoin utilization deacetylase AcuC-like enzyme
MASIDELALVHTPDYVKQVEQAAKHAPFYMDMDTPVSAESYDIARLAAGGTMQCVDSLCRGELRKIFAFVRPPGHHADRKSAGGFCLFNNVALAAAYARARHKLDRIAIIDTDVHHGNGTQAIFYRDPQALYISSHQFPFYPGTGDFDETGDGPGSGYTLNFPMPEGSGDSTFIPVYANIISAVLDQYAPQIILVSSGFDGHFRDPIGGLSFTSAGYGAVAAHLIKAAERNCEGKILFVLEGGYNYDALQECARNTLIEMETKCSQAHSVRESPLFAEISRQSAKFVRGQWKW